MTDITTHSPAVTRAMGRFWRRYREVEAAKAETVTSTGGSAHPEVIVLRNVTHGTTVRLRTVVGRWEDGAYVPTKRQVARVRRQLCRWPGCHGVHCAAGMPHGEIAMNDPTAEWQPEYIAPGFQVKLVRKSQNRQ